jgi:hypothetical protein
MPHTILCLKRFEIRLLSAMKTPASPRSHFDVVTLFLSVASLAGTALTMMVCLASLRGRGAEFGTHMLLYFMFVAQIWALPGCVLLAAIIAACLRELRMKWSTTVWFLLALAGLGGQYYWLLRLNVDPSSVP